MAGLLVTVSPGIAMGVIVGWAGCAAALEVAGCVGASTEAGWEAACPCTCGASPNVAPKRVALLGAVCPCMPMVASILAIPSTPHC
jgi:hypothetical protein